MASPFTVPATSAVPNMPLYVPVSFSPFCRKTKLGDPLPSSVCTLNSHLPLTSCANAAQDASNRISQARLSVAVDMN